MLRSLFDAAVDAVSADRCVPPHLPEKPAGRTVVLGAGKASAAMARAMESRWKAPLEGLVVTRYGHGLPCERIEVVEAGHPLPDSEGLVAAHRLLELAESLGEDDLALVLLSGGGSALLSLPAPEVDLDVIRTATDRLLRSGAAIHEINVVRKHLSSILGGRLAEACRPAPVVTLAISDVPGDDPSVLASGPTVPDPSTLAEARSIAERYDLGIPIELWGRLAETPKPGDPIFERTEFHVIASSRTALEAAARIARDRGFTPWILGDDLEGEAREVARDHADLVRRIPAGEGPVTPPCVLLSGGETTVTVRGSGRGGRNTEYLLGLLTALGPDGLEGVSALAADTDGIDGTEDHAGAFVRPDAWRRATSAGLDPQRFLDDNDSYTFFERLGDLLVTGPTRTNVMDFRAIWIGG